MGFAISPSLKYFATRGPDEIADSKVFAGKIQISRAHPKLFCRCKPVNEQGLAKPLALIGILYRYPDLCVRIVAFEYFQNTNSATIRLDAQHEIRAGPVCDDLHRAVWKGSHESAQSRDASKTFVMRRQGAAPVDKFARQHICAWWDKYAGH